MIKGPQYYIKTGNGPQTVTVAMQEFADRLQNLQSTEDIWNEICREYNQYGIEFLIYMFVRPSAPESNSLVFSNLPKWFSDYYYMEQRWKDDPFLDICNTFMPVLTGREYVDNYAHFLPENQQEFIREAGETGAISGISSPVRLKNSGHFGGWNFLTSMKREAFDKHISTIAENLHLMGFIAHEAMLSASNINSDIRANGNLSVREKECLLWLARGLHSYEIAERLNIKIVTVDLHFKRIRAKLGATTREEALVKAITSGEIVP